jgi:hypothetical protein
MFVAMPGLIRCELKGGESTTVIYFARNVLFVHSHLTNHMWLGISSRSKFIMMS